MRDHFDEFDEIKDYIDKKLTDIYVTEKLKAKTLEQLSPQKRHSHPWMVAPAAAAVALVILFNSPVKVNITSKLPIEQANYALNNAPDTPNEAKGNTTNKIAPAKSSDSENVKSEKNTQKQNPSTTQKNSQTQNINAPSNSNNTTKQQTSSDSSLLAQAGSNKNNSAPPVQGAGNPETKANKPSSTSQSSIGSGTKENTSTSGSANTPVVAVIPSVDNDTKALSPFIKSHIDIQMEKASDFLQHPLLLPTSIPEKFQLINILVPSNNTEDATEVKITYLLNGQYFILYESLKSGIKDLESSKTIMINQCPAVVSTIELTTDDTVQQTKTELEWEDDSLHYRLEGNIPEDQLLEIAKSLK